MTIMNFLAPVVVRRKWPPSLASVVNVEITPVLNVNVGLKG